MRQPLMPAPGGRKERNRDWLDGRLRSRANAATAAGSMIAAIAVALAGCGSLRSSTDGAAPFNTGLDHLLAEPSAETPNGMSRPDIQDWLARDAELLPSLAEGRISEAPIIADRSPIATNTGPSVSIDTPAAPTEGSSTRSKGRSDRSFVHSDSREATTVEESPLAQRRRLTTELATLLRREVSESASPLRPYAALAALELLEPGVVPDPTSIPALTPREIEMLGAWRDLFRRADEELSSATGDIGAFAMAVSELAVRMQEWETLDISKAVLCSRVDGYGQFTELPGPKLLAARRNAAIVYIEVENFTRQASAGENGEPGFLVELTQELSLYHDADGLLAWRQPEQQIRDFSRNHRRDFFIVQRIDLPETLSVGAYRLKVTMRDKATGAVAEKIVPIEMVADAALVRAQ